MPKIHIFYEKMNYVKHYVAYHWGGVYLKSYVISVLVDNNPGVLTRVCALFNRRGFNLESVTGGESENKSQYRLTLISSVEEEDDLNQIMKQIRKLEDVHKVVQLEESNSICKQIMLIKVSAEGSKRQEIMNIVNIFRVSIVDVASTTLTIEITGDSNKLTAFHDLIKPFGIVEMVSSGFIAMHRGNKSSIAN